eukprot:g14772.t1
MKLVTVEWETVVLISPVGLLKRSQKSKLASKTKIPRMLLVARRVVENGVPRWTQLQLLQLSKVNLELTLEAGLVELKEFDQKYWILLNPFRKNADAGDLPLLVVATNLLAGGAVRKRKQTETFTFAESTPQDKVSKAPGKGPGRPRKGGNNCHRTNCSCPFHGKPPQVEDGPATGPTAKGPHQTLFLTPPLLCQNHEDGESEDKQQSERVVQLEAELKAIPEKSQQDINEAAAKAAAAAVQQLTPFVQQQTTPPSSGSAAGCSLDAKALADEICGRLSGKLSADSQGGDKADQQALVDQIVARLSGELKKDARTGNADDGKSMADQIVTRMSAQLNAGGYFLQVNSRAVCHVPHISCMLTGRDGRDNGGGQEDAPSLADQVIARLTGAGGSNERPFLGSLSDGRNRNSQGRVLVDEHSSLVPTEQIREEVDASEEGDHSLEKEAEVPRVEEEAMMQDTQDGQEQFTAKSSNQYKFGMDQTKAYCTGYQFTLPHSPPLWILLLPGDNGLKEKFVILDEMSASVEWETVVLISPVGLLKRSQKSKLASKTKIPRMLLVARRVVENGVPRWTQLQLLQLSKVNLELTLEAGLVELKEFDQKYWILLNPFRKNADAGDLPLLVVATNLLAGGAVRKRKQTETFTFAESTPQDKVSKAPGKGPGRPRKGGNNCHRTNCSCPFHGKPPQVEDGPATGPTAKGPHQTLNHEDGESEDKQQSERVAQLEAELKAIPEKSQQDINEAAAKAAAAAVQQLTPFVQQQTTPPSSGSAAGCSLDAKALADEICGRLSGKLSADSQGGDKADQQALVDQIVARLSGELKKDARTGNADDGKSMADQIGQFSTGRDGRDNGGGQEDAPSLADQVIARLTGAGGSNERPFLGSLSDGRNRNSQGRVSLFNITELDKIILGLESFLKKQQDINEAAAKAAAAAVQQLTPFVQQQTTPPSSGSAAGGSLDAKALADEICGRLSGKLSADSQGGDKADQQALVDQIVAVDESEIDESSPKPSYSLDTSDAAQWSAGQGGR